MGANQSNNNNDPGTIQAASSRHASAKQINKSKTHIDSPATVSVMSTEEPQCQEAASRTERARKRARTDSEEIIDLNDEVCDGKGSTQPPSGESPFSCEVFVSGASCRLPESNNLEEFWHNLIDRRDMVTEDNRRWQPGLHDLPRRNGKLKDVSKFDAEFFRINPTQAHAMDPQLRLLFEVAYEAIIDAGYNPSELRGSQTGVFIGNMFMEALEATSNDAKSRHVGYGLTSACDSMLSNYLSFYFDFKGPSLTVNTACSSSLAAFDLAVKSLLCGQCEFAIAAGTNLLLKPGTALHMLRLGMLSKDGSCKAFDASADGYVRSEGIVAVLLTTKENARRAYAQVLNSMSSCDGHKVEGIAYPSSESQRELIWGVHYEIGLDPSKIFYIEAHGTGTQAGDFEECKALDEAIAQNRCTSAKSEEITSNVGDGREKNDMTPLLVGSVKSNMGHCEPASGLAGVAKVILSYQHGLIPPNLHYKSPNPRIASLLENRLSVVTMPTNLPPNTHIGINSFGFGGAITHVIFKGCENSDESLRKGDIVSKSHVPKVPLHEDVTMVLPVTSRTKQGLKELLDFVATYRTDKEVLTLLHHSFSSAPADTHSHRGYVLWNKEELVTTSTALPPRTTAAKQQVWFIFDGMGSQWSGIGKDLLIYTIFADTIKKCYNALPSDVNNLILYSQSEMAENSNLIIDEIAAVCAVSIGLVELLKAVGIQPDGLIGHSLGELVLCYADGALSLEECMQTAYWRIRCVMESEIPKGAMATVGLPWEEVKSRCPDTVWPVCSNSLQNVTVSGEASAVEKFIAELNQEKIFTKMVKSSGLPYHSPLMKPAANEKTFGILNGIIKNPKPKSNKWVVTALPADEDPELVTCCAEFHIRSLVTPVYFYEALQKIPPGSVVIEIGAHALLQAILKRSLSSNFTIVPLQDWKERDQSIVFMRALGTCHNAGLSINPLALVEPVRLPVGPHTPSIGHLMSWEHVEEWHVPKPEDFMLHSGSTNPMAAAPPFKLYVTKNIKIDPRNSILYDELALADYKIDSSIVVPPSYLMIIIWQLFTEAKDLPLIEVPICLSDVIFPAQVEVTNTPVDLTFTLSTISGHFEVILNNSQLVTTGNISTSDHYKKDANTTINTSTSEEMSSPRSKSEDDFAYPQDDLYKELALRGYQLGHSYRVLHELFIDSLGLKSGNLSIPILTPLSRAASLLCLIDGLFQVNLLQSCEQFLVGGSYFELKGFSSLTVDPSIVFANICPPAHLSVSCGYDDESQKFTSWTKGLSVDDAIYVKRPRRMLTPEPRIEMYNFHPYFCRENIKEEKYLLDAQSSISVMLEIICENISSKEVTLLQVFNETRVFDSSLADFVSKIAKSCSIKSIQHDLIIAGASPDSKSQPTPTKSKLSEHTVRVESFSHNLSLTLHYDVIITSSVSTAQSLFEHSKLASGSFVLAILNSEGAVQDLTTSESDRSVCPMLVAERQFIASEITTDNQIGYSANNASRCLLKLYHFVNADLSSEENISIIQVSVAAGNFSWISKLKKLLATKDGPKRIYLVSELQREYPSGLLGMMNCLRLEGYGNRLRCIQLMDLKWEELLRDHAHLWDHIKRADMLMNVVCDGQVGSYVHTPLALPHPNQDDLVNNSVPMLITDETGFICSRSKTYIITGGLGGFGLELAEWLVEKGARYVVLTSRTGKMTPYKKRKLQILDTKGVKVCEVSTLNVSNEEQAFQLVKMAANLSPKGIGGVFHLAVVLHDCLFENQTAKRFKTVLSPKSTGILNIDKALREVSTLHPSYDTPLFVVFSSATSGLGNTGQTNYAFANSSMEHLCELRNLDGLHGSIAIQWGAIAEVGILHTIMGGRDIESIAGTKPQPMHSCLSCLDSILNSDRDCAIVSCYIPALQPPSPFDERSLHKDSCDTSSLVAAKKDVKMRICQVLGIRDPSRVNVDSQLDRLGLDSLMNFEVRSLLENEFGVSISSRDLPKMTLRDIVEATSEPTGKDGAINSTVTTGRHLSIAGEVSGVEKIASETSLGTQSSALNVMGRNDE